MRCIGLSKLGSVCVCARTYARTHTERVPGFLTIVPYTGCIAHIQSALSQRPQLQALSQRHAALFQSLRAALLQAVHASQARLTVSPSHCFSVLLSHCLTVSLSHCLTVSLPYCLYRSAGCLRHHRNEIAACSRRYLFPKYGAVSARILQLSDRGTPPRANSPTVI